jgi:uroporphyrinogen decarboxylase
MKKLFLAALSGETTARPPIWLMRQAGRYLPEYQAVRAEAGSFLELCRRPDLSAEVTMQPIRRFGMDAAILFADILLIPYALGQELDYREGEGPVLARIGDTRDLAQLKVGGAAARLAPVSETVRKVAAMLPPDCALIGFAGAPWTVATYMIEGGNPGDAARTKRWAFSDPEGFQRLIGILVNTTGDYLAAQIAAGAEAIQLFESHAGLLSGPEFHRWCVEPIRQIIARLKGDFPDVPVIVFPRGAGPHYEGFAKAVAADCIGIDTLIASDWAAVRLQKDCAIQGNLDPQLVVVGGKPMLETAGKLIADLAGGPHVFNLGHGVVPPTPPEHVGALVDFVKSWRRDKRG